MLKYGQGFVEIVRHENSDGAFGVFPIYVNSKENSATPINSDAGEYFLQCVDQMQCIIFGCIFHSKVINN